VLILKLLFAKIRKRLQEVIKLLLRRYRYCSFKIFISITFYMEGRGHEYIYKPVLSTGILYHNVINCLINRFKKHRLHRYNTLNREDDSAGNFQRCYTKVKRRKNKEKINEKPAINQSTGNLVFNHKD
jgi:hypothetical protein